MAKTLDDLKASRKLREHIISEIGFVPCSIVDAKPNIVGAHEHDERKQCAVQKKKIANKGYVDKAFDISGKSCRNKGMLTTFPTNIAAFIVKFYSEPNDIVLDPMAGHNSRCEVTYKLGRSYIGYDICHEFMDFNRAVAKNIEGQSLFSNNAKNKITLHEQSSEKMVEKRESVDMIYTSPPYWDIEYYGPEAEQLGYKKTYKEFLAGLGRVFKECYRVLKYDKYCIINVNDFRKNNKFYAFHVDTMHLLECAGFTIHDIWIKKYANAMGQIFASQVYDRKVVAKMHEYAWVCKKTKEGKNG
jgi:DNA modification methylase